MISVHFQGKPFNIMVIQVYALTSNTEEAEVEWFNDDLQEPSRNNTQKICHFHYRGLEFFRKIGYKRFTGFWILQDILGVCQHIEENDSGRESNNIYIPRCFFQGLTNGHIYV